LSNDDGNDITEGMIDKLKSITRNIKHTIMQKNGNNNDNDNNTIRISKTSFHDLTHLIYPDMQNIQVNHSQNFNLFLN
jgi:hypothetical protein